MKADQHITYVRNAFADIPRPTHFTNHRHCDECADHDRTLQAYDPDSIGLAQLGSPAWDPICFVTPDAFLYYFPALVRLTVADEGSDRYLEQFLFHVTYDGEKSRFFTHFNQSQRAATLATLQYIQTHKAQRINEWKLADQLQASILLWEKMVAAA